MRCLYWIVYALGNALLGQIISKIPLIPLQRTEKRRKSILSGLFSQDKVTSNLPNCSKWVRICIPSK